MPGTTDVDAEQRLAFDDQRAVDALDRLADDLVVPRVFELDAIQVGTVALRPWSRARRSSSERPRGRVTHHTGLGLAFASGTLHRRAAAVISICRPAAPTRASGPSSAVSPCCRPRTGVRIWRDRASACSMLTCFQSTSSSSAISIGSMVLMPWPISGFFDMMVTILSGAICTYASSIGRRVVEAIAAAFVVDGKRN